VPAFGHALPEQLTARPSLIDYNPAANASATVTSSDGWARFTVLTPCLLHFSLAHLVMDVVLFWALGRRIERGLGAWAAVATFLWPILIVSGLHGLWRVYSARRT
jgi:membrane associated rhomboid family serine protease